MLDVVCLALTIFLEARSEPLGAQYQVGAVILNRVESDDFPDSVCDVVNQPYQFATAIGDGGTVKERATAAMIAVDLYYNYIPNDETLWFYDPDKVNPGWAKNLVPVGRVGTHLFLRKP